MGIFLTLLLLVLVVILLHQVPSGKNLILKQYTEEDNKDKVFKWHLLIHLLQVAIITLSLWGVHCLSKTAPFASVGLSINPMAAVLGMINMALIALYAILAYLFVYSYQCYTGFKFDKISE